MGPGPGGAGGALSTAHDVIIFKFIQTRVNLFSILDVADVCLSAVFICSGYNNLRNKKV